MVAKKKILPMYGPTSCVLLPKICSFIMYGMALVTQAQIAR